MSKSILFFIGVALFGCTEITFKEAQPRGVQKLTEFPRVLRGNYTVPQDSGSEKYDTVYIEASRYRINSVLKDADWVDRGVLCDSMVLKQYKGYYFLNFFTDEQWIVRVFRQEKNGNILLYEINLSDKQKIEMLKETFNPEIIEKENSTYYRIDPSPKKLLTFIKKNYSLQEPLKKIK